MSEQMKKVVRDGSVAVLVSPGYGAGWSTWADKHREWCLFSPAVVAWVEGGKKGDIEAIVRRELGDDGPYTGGAEDLVIEWVPAGTFFRIDEYDGSESLELAHDVDWSVA